MSVEIIETRRFSSQRVSGARISEASVLALDPIETFTLGEQTAGPGGAHGENVSTSGTNGEKELIAKGYRRRRRDTGIERYRGILARLEMRTRFNVPLAIPGPLSRRKARLNRLIVDGIFPGRRIRRIRAVSRAHQPWLQTPPIYPARAFVFSLPLAGLYLPSLSLSLVVVSLSFFNFCRPFSFRRRNLSDNDFATDEILFPRATSQVYAKSFLAEEK